MTTRWFRSRWLLLALVALPTAAGAQGFDGIAGAGPKAASGRPGCFVYDRWVVTTGEGPGGDSSWVRVARRGGHGRRAERKPCELPAALERLYAPCDTFQGMLGDVLLVRLAGSADGGALVLEQLTGARAKSTVPYAGGAPRLAGGAIALSVPLDTPECGGFELFAAGIDRPACQLRAREWVACHRRAAGGRLARSADPFPADAFTRPGAGDACQVRLYEEARIDLATLEVGRTGRLRAQVWFSPVG